MMIKRFLNVQFRGQPDRINITDMQDLSEIRKEIKTCYGPDIPGPVVRIQLWKNTEYENSLISTWKQFKSLPHAYFEEENLYLTIVLLPSPTPSRQSSGISLEQ
ncbi:hypothetical protein BC833DRAFT_624672, partial [Globomyces pollinis-pini]